MSEVFAQQACAGMCLRGAYLIHNARLRGRLRPLLVKVGAVVVMMDFAALDDVVRSMRLRNDGYALFQQVLCSGRGYVENMHNGERRS